MYDPVDEYELMSRLQTRGEQLALRQNVATNGRLFIVLLAAACALAGSPFMVAMCALVVGISYVVDQLPDGGPSTFLRFLTIAASIAILIATLVICW